MINLAIRHIGVAVLLGLGLFFRADAQINNNALSDSITVLKTDSGKFGIDISSFNYLRNTEYFNNIELGRTLFGSQLHPKLFYQPLPNVVIQTGIFLQQDFGAIPYLNKITPTLSLKITNSKQTQAFVFGTLEGALAHGMIEPVFNINSAIEKRIEQGAQYKITTPRLFFDSWINWERFIKHGDAHQEQFTAGLNVLPTVYKSKNGLSIAPNAQLLVFHKGGQIDTDTLNMVLISNSALGVIVKKSFIKNNSENEFGMSSYWVNHTEKTNSGYYAFRSGTCYYQNIWATHNKLTAMLSYWSGNGFIAPNGTPIYQSVSADKPTTSQTNRNLLFMRLLYSKPIGNVLNLNARVEPVYDLDSKTTEFSFSLYISYKLHRAFKK